MLSCFSENELLCLLEKKNHIKYLDLISENILYVMRSGNSPHGEI